MTFAALMLSINIKATKMRTLTIVLAAGLLAGAGTAQANDSARVHAIAAPPQPVAAAFAARFPDARDVKWKTADSKSYLAHFKTRDKKDVAYYAPNGKWQATETPVSWSWKLPPAVRKGWRNSNYAAWYIVKINKVATPDQTLYCLDVNNMPLLDDNHVFNFETEYKLYFSPDGRLVREEMQP